MVKRLHELESELKNPPEPLNGKLLNRVCGSMIGLALGDALGACVEFRPRSFLEQHPITDLHSGGTWGLGKGEFTDDTSMALCLATSLIVHQDFFPYDQLVRYKWWFHKGYMSSNGRCFDIGDATRQSLLLFERRQLEFADKNNIDHTKMDYLTPDQLQNKFDVFCSEEHVAGNGALMRLASVPLFFCRHPKDAVEFSGVSGKTTHGNSRAYDACRYYGALIVAALHGAKKSELLDNNFYSKYKDWFNNKPLHPDIMQITLGSYKRKGGYNDGIRATGYVVNTLEAALWAFWSDEDSFEKGVLAAINLGEDTDTTAAIYSQLAGAYYGYEKLPKKWLQFLYARNFIECLSKWIVYEGERWNPNASLTSILSASSAHPQRSNNSVSLSTKQDPYSNKSASTFQPNLYQFPEKFSTTSQQPVSTVRKPTKVGTEQNRNEQLMPNLEPYNTTTSSLTSQHGSSTKNSSRHEPASNNIPRLIPGNLLSRVTSLSVSKPEYFVKDLETCDDTCRWIMSLGKEYERYIPNFKRRNIDGFRLLNCVDKENLFLYGVQDANHQQTILRGIEELKRYSQPKPQSSKIGNSHGRHRP